MTAKANPGKKLSITVQFSSYLRFPIKTHQISDKDDIVTIVRTYAKEMLSDEDLVVISERVVAITQGRAIPIKKIKPSWWAKKLYTYVHNHPGGIGLRSPYTMEIAIREAGLWRILLAAGLSVLTKPLGIRGVFYHVVGNNINAIDGPTPYTLPPGNTSVTLGPKNPEQVAQAVENVVGAGVVIIDANDYGVRVLARSPKAVAINFPIKKIFADNPMGQSKEQTPLIILRKKK